MYWISWQHASRRPVDSDRPLPAKVLYLRCYTRTIPTRRPRHTITETAPVERELRLLRRMEPDSRIDFKELVILGARVKAAELESDRPGARPREELIERFLGMRASEEIDAHAGLALHESGWTRDR